MSLSFSESKTFKLNAFQLIDKIKILAEQCFQLSRIGTVVLDQQMEENEILSTYGSFVCIVQKIIEYRQRLSKFNEIIECCLSLIRDYEYVFNTFQDLNSQQRKISSKVSVNKQIFAQCKNDISDLIKFFNSYETIYPTLCKIYQTIEKKK
ncbi:hypothetical protein TTHERM_00143510 (macronuclear) [Tetrahymena thermophila SB210]|uniref:Uncharacterized protein n=1 Tax=Tetrahymena thermophila (strain SB210) TaxID=312017 RepID=I7MI38_TETTS|nr:hypothetical protein TTHERM_00143510 [Tetrahymena thermophila SB210]EAR90845.1 hypothetical protein TTHERM_00143510 [Tetrahymena thermophila SB210]|eukprot:XP_001011090.1 hypothetical protein TTHERM_00143510 [Tetrahymena thermophila SB210]